MLSWRNIVRLVLMSFHFLFTLVPLGLCYAQTGDLALVACHAQALIAVLVYIPAAFVLAIVDSPSRFTQAGGEVGYLVVQQCLWLPSGAFGAYWGSNAVNKAAHAAGVANTDTITAGYQAAAGFGFFQFFLTLCWMIWVIVAVYQVGGDVDEMFKVATHLVIDGLAPTTSTSTSTESSRKGGRKRQHKGEAGRQEEGTYEEKKGLQDYRSRGGAIDAERAGEYARAHPQAGGENREQGNGFRRVQEDRRHSAAPLQSLTDSGDRYARPSNRYQDPYQLQQEYAQHYQQPPHAQYTHSRSNSSCRNSAPLPAVQPMYAQNPSSISSLYDAAQSAEHPIQPYRQAQMYDAQDTPIAPRPSSVHADHTRSAMPQSRQSTLVPAADAQIEPPAQAYQSRASQRYLQQQQAQQQAAPAQQADLSRPAPAWEGTPMSRASSNESRRSSDLPRIQTNV